MLYEWGGNKPADSVMTPDERANAIRQYEQEIATFNAAFCWESKYDYEPAQLTHREHLRNLIRAMEARISELSKPR